MENILHTENSKPIGVSHIGKTCKKHMEYHFMLVVYYYQFSYQLQVSETLARCVKLAFYLCVQEESVGPLYIIFHILCPPCHV